MKTRGMNCKSTFFVFSRPTEFLKGSGSVFPMLKSLRVLQKPHIKIVAHAVLHLTVFFLFHRLSSAGK